MHSNASLPDWTFRESIPKSRPVVFLLNFLVAFRFKGLARYGRSRCPLDSSFQGSDMFQKSESGYKADDRPY